MAIANLARVVRRASEALLETVVVRDGVDELFLSAAPLAGEDLVGMMSRAARSLRAGAWRVVGMTVFDGGPGSDAAVQSLRETLGPVECPITWLEREEPHGGPPAGLELHAIRGPEVRALRLHGRVVGSAWEDAAARHCELGDLRDGNIAQPAPMQARRVFEDMAAALAQADMEFKHVYRTWFRNRDILGWYRDFNRVRTDYYTALGVFEGLLPASTGIGAANPFGAALVAGLWAMEPKASEARAYAVVSPLQDSACKYGSSFSRAVELDLGDHRRLTISGTASIDSAGKTAHVGDITAQVDTTMQVVAALLHSRGMDWSDATRGVAYFRRAADMGAYARWCQNHEVGPLPIIVSHHTVCRGDLLYEIEADAVAGVPPAHR